MRSLLLESLKTWKWSKQSLLTRETLNYGSVYQKSVRALIIRVSNLHQRITLLRQSVQDALVTLCPYPGHISYQTLFFSFLLSVFPCNVALLLEDGFFFTGSFFLGPDHSELPQNLPYFSCSHPQRIQLVKHLINLKKISHKTPDHAI